MIDKLFKASVLILLSGAALGAYWLWFDNPAIISNVHARVINAQPLHAGDALMIELSYCQSREAIPESGVRTIENSYIYPLANHHVNSAVGCYSKPGDEDSVIPLGAVLGPHNYRFELRYQVNPLKTAIVRFPDIPFEVVASPPVLKGAKGDRGKRGEKGDPGDPGARGPGDHYSIFGK